MKTFFKKAWIHIKTYWYVLVIILVGIILFLVGSNRDIKKIFRLITNERERAKKEIEIVEKSNKEIISGIEENVDDFIDDKKELDSEFESDKKELDKKKENMSKELVNNIKENPSKILSRIAEEFGWDYGR